MLLQEFQHLARLYVIGALEENEMTAFEQGRRLFGQVADAYVAECRHLESVFALSLQPQQPRREAKQKLISMIKNRRPSGSFFARLGLQMRDSQGQPG